MTEGKTLVICADGTNYKPLQTQDSGTLYQIRRAFLRAQPRNGRKSNSCSVDRELLRACA